MATVFTSLAREEDAVYPTDYRGEIEAIIARWRRGRRQTGRRCRSH
jgi:hypothetical protein